MSELELNLLSLIEDIVADDEGFEWEWLAINKKLRGRAKAMQARLALVYEIAHGYNTEHSCYHVHDNWRRKALEITRSGW